MAFGIDLFPISISVSPAQAGTQTKRSESLLWIPTCAGITKNKTCDRTTASPGV